MEIGTLVREKRERVGLTQVQLARRAGISQSTVSAVERGTVGEEPGVWVSLRQVPSRGGPNPRSWVKA